MKISLNWLSDFVDLSGHTPAVIADRLTLATAEVEDIEVVERFVAGVVVAEILSAAPMQRPAGEAGESGKQLWRVVVDAGGGRKHTTVCGAPNVRGGMKA